MMSGSSTHNEHYIPTISQGQVLLGQAHSRRANKKLDAITAHSLENMTGESVVGDSGATSTCMGTMFDKDIETLYDGPLRPTRTTFGTAKAGSKRMKPEGQGDITVCLIDRQGRLWIKTMWDVYAFHKSEVAMTLLSPAGLHESRGHRGDQIALTTGTPELSQLTLRDGETNLTGTFDVDYQQKSYFVHMYPIEALLHYEPPDNLNDADAIIGDREYAQRILENKGHLRSSKGAQDEENMTAAATAPPPTTTPSHTEDTGDDGDGPYNPTTAMPTRSKNTLLKAKGHTGCSNGTREANPDELDDLNDTLQINGETSHTYICETSYNCIAVTSEIEAADMLSAGRDPSSIEDTARWQCENEARRRTGRGNHGPPVQVTRKSPTMADGVTAPPTPKPNIPASPAQTEPTLEEEKEDQQVQTQATPVCDVTDSPRVRATQLTSEIFHLWLGHPGPHAERRTQLRHLHVKYPARKTRRDKRSPPGSTQGGGDVVEQEKGTCQETWRPTRPRGTCCESCVMGKGTKVRQRTTPAESPSQQPGGRIFMDCAGPFPLSKSKCRWAVIAVDEASGWTVVLPAPNKKASTAVACLKRMQQYFSHLGLRVGSVRSDNGAEFQTEFTSFADSQGIKHELTAYYHPQGNAKAERGWRRLICKMRTMAHHAGMLDVSRVWDELMHHSCTLANITYKESIKQSPYQHLHPASPGHRFTEIPSAEGLMVWGAKCALSHLPAQVKGAWKGDSKSTPGYYVGRSRISRTTPRFYCPTLRGGTYVETRHYHEIDKLWEPRKALPSDLKSHQGHQHPARASDQPTLAESLADENNNFFESEGTETDSDDTSDSDTSIDENEERDANAGPPQDLNVDPIDLQLTIGRRFAREFEEGWFTGTITSKSKRGRGIQITVTYHDGDVEDISGRDATNFLQSWYIASKRDTSIPPWDTPDTNIGVGSEGVIRNIQHVKKGDNYEALRRGAELAEQQRHPAETPLLQLQVDELLNKLAEGEGIDYMMGNAQPSYYDGLVEDDNVQEGLDRETVLKEKNYHWVNQHGDCDPDDPGAIRLLQAEHIRVHDLAVGEDRRDTVRMMCPDMIEGLPPTYESSIATQGGDEGARRVRPSDNVPMDPLEGKAESIEDDGNDNLSRVILKNGQTVYVDPDCPPISWALNGPDRDKWLQACVAELHGQIGMNCWTVVQRHQLPVGAKVLKTGWRLLRKRTRGIITRWKARAYCCGYSQLPSAHYDPHDISSPTPRAATFRMLVATGVERGLTLWSGDTSLAFLHADVDREIWIKAFPKGEIIMPEIFSGSPDQMLKLHKSLWGLKQASNLFFKALRGHLLGTMGFSPAGGDRCLYFRAKDKDGKILRDYDPNEDRPGVTMCYLLTYVDDVAAATTDRETWLEVVDEIKKKFAFRDEGPLENFLGIEIDEADDGGVVLRHCAKIDRIAEACQVLKGKDGAVRVRNTPLPAGTQCPEREFAGQPPDEAELAEMSKYDYRMMIGMILHTYVWVRPDIGPAIGQLCKHVNAPRLKHIRLAQHLAEYLYTTRTMGLHYVRGTARQVDVWVDADYAMCQDTRKSITGYAIIMSGAAVSWMSKKQSFVSLSSCEAELGALRDVSAEILALRKDLLLIDPQLANTRWRVWEDNQAAIAIMHGEGKYENRKHLAVRALWCQSLVGSVMDVLYVSTLEQVADCLTKCLPGPALKKHRDVLLNEGVHIHQRKRCSGARSHQRHGGFTGPGLWEGSAGAA